MSRVSVSKTASAHAHARANDPSLVASYSSPNLFSSHFGT